MKKPTLPPNVDEFGINATLKMRLQIAKEAGTPFFTDKLPHDMPYPHWDQLQHLAPPNALTTEAWWHWLKLRRRFQYKAIPLQDANGQPFALALVDKILKDLNQIDQGADGRIGIAAPVMPGAGSDYYYISSLMEEAITSSQLEGAVTTRRVAKELLLTQRPPVDKSERMIVNNYRTMQRVRELQRQPLTSDIVFELHRITTENTLDDADAAGVFRRDDDDIVIQDSEGNVFHTPPPVAELPNRMQAMCDFANGLTPNYFVHPVLRAIILHFWLAYDHPFVDGNGRAARALFYWSMLRNGYWLCEYLSISRILKKAPSQYGRSFLYTETDDNDLTYFVLYQLEILKRAIKELHEYIAKKSAQNKTIEQRLHGIIGFNHRQRALIGHALRHPGFSHTIAGHGASHAVVYQTARTDLLNLAERGLLQKQKIGKIWHFTAAIDLENKLRERGKESAS